MFTGLDLTSMNDTKAIGRLVAAGVLQKGRRGLQTTERWQSEMLRALSTHPSSEIQASLQHTIQGTFPETSGPERDAMARVMLLIEAREAGWTGE